MILTPRSKVEVILNLYERGYLCDCRCKRKTNSGMTDRDGNAIYTMSTKHDVLCKGREKAKELMGFDPIVNESLSRG